MRKPKPYGIETKYVFACGTRGIDTAVGNPDLRSRRLDLLPGLFPMARLVTCPTYALGLAEG